MTQEPDPQHTPSVPLTLERSGTPDHPVITAAGEIDVASSPLLRAELAEVLEHSPSTITLDLAAVSFIDSSGLGVLVGSLRRLREQHADASLQVLHTQLAVRKVFDITGLDELFELRS
jgi:anti-sigma B factor antagonist